MFRRGFRRLFRIISARDPLAFSFGAPSPPLTAGRFLSLFPCFASFPLFAAHHLDAAKVTELLLWILAFATYVILGVVILIRISRSVKERRNNSFDYGSETEMFRDLYRRKLISPEEYNNIRLRLRDRLVGEVLNHNSVPSDMEAEDAPRSEDLENHLRLTALMEAKKFRGNGIVSGRKSPSSRPKSPNLPDTEEFAKTRPQSSMREKPDVPPVIVYNPNPSAAENVPGANELEEDRRRFLPKTNSTLPPVISGDSSSLSGSEEDAPSGEKFEKTRG